MVLMIESDGAKVCTIAAFIFWESVLCKGCDFDEIVNLLHVIAIAYTQFNQKEHTYVRECYT